MAKRLQHEWRLLEGCLVEVTHLGQAIRRGRVDTVAPDGSLLWIAQDGAQTRQMFAKSEGFEAWTGFAATTPTLNEEGKGQTECLTSCGSQSSAWETSTG